MPQGPSELPKIKVLYSGDDENPRDDLYDPWLPRTAREAVSAATQCREKTVSQLESADLVVFHEYWRPRPCHVAMELVERAKVPVLMLPDGILEYRCFWEHPQIGDGIGFMPVPAHKVACIGESQARILESWGNAGKCEVVGLPRIDSFAASGQGIQALRESPDVRYVLVMTARTPAFTEPQWQIVAQSIRDLKSWFETRPRHEGRPIVPVWRVAQPLARQVSLSNPAFLPPDCPLADLMAMADAVITTPSTAMLEGMLKDKPVALLDYHNVPHYVPAAWNIAAAEHVPAVVHGLLGRDPRRMLHQRHILKDSLAEPGSAAARMCALAAAMAARGNACRVASLPVSFPEAPLLMPARTPAANARAAHPAESLFPAGPAAKAQSEELLRGLCSAYSKENDKLADKVRCYKEGIGFMKSSVLYALYRIMRRRASRKP